MAFPVGSSCCCPHVVPALRTGRGGPEVSCVPLSRPGMIGRQAVKVARLSLLIVCIIAAFMPASLHAARHPVIISGGVTTTYGRPLADAFICIPALNVSAVTD